MKMYLITLVGVGEIQFKLLNKKEWGWVIKNEASKQTMNNIKEKLMLEYKGDEGQIPSPDDEWVQTWNDRALLMPNFEDKYISSTHELLKIIKKYDISISNEEMGSIY